MTLLVEDGGTLVVEHDDERIGSGPWARWFASAVVPDESSARAESGRVLARAGAVHSASVAAGSIGARVTDPDDVEHVVSIDAPPVPDAAWKSATRTARARAGLAGSVEGRAQSVHLAHLMSTEHDVPLAPSAAAVRRTCSCPEARRAAECAHVAAVAFAVADAIDRDPALFLRWRGCDPVAPRASRSGDPWAAGILPEPRAVRALPAGAVLKRLGRSGIRVGGVDLADALAPAYEAFAATRKGGMTDVKSSG